MNKWAMYLIVVLSILLGSATFQINVYQQWMPKMLWATQTLWINLKINREGWHKCLYRES